MEVTPNTIRSGISYVSSSSNPEFEYAADVGRFVNRAGRHLRDTFEFFRKEPPHGPFGHGRLDLSAPVKSIGTRVFSGYVDVSQMGKKLSREIWLKRPYPKK